MDVLIAVFLVFGIMIAFSNTVLSYILHKKYMNLLSLLYFVLVLSLFIDNSTAVLIVYGLWDSVSSFTQTILSYTYIMISSIAHIGYLFVAIMVLRTIFHIKKLPKLFWVSLIIIYTAEFIYFYINREFFDELYFVYYSFTMLIYGVILASVIVDIRNISNVTEPKIRSMLKRVMIVFVFIFTVMMIENMIPTEISLGGPIVFTILNALGIYYSLKYIFLDNELLESTSFEKISKVLLEHNITERETEIIVLILESYTNKEIADSLFISEGTVKNHIYNIYKKLDVRNRTELVNFLKPLN